MLFRSYADVTPAVLKRLAADAGVTMVCADEVPVFANQRLLAVHTATGGEKQITLPGPWRAVRELYTGCVVPVRDRQFRYTFQAPDTALFELLSQLG